MWDALPANYPRDIFAHVHKTYIDQNKNLQNFITAKAAINKMPINKVLNKLQLNSIMEYSSLLKIKARSTCKIVEKSPRYIVTIFLQNQNSERNVNTSICPKSMIIIIWWHRIFLERQNKKQATAGVFQEGNWKSKTEEASFLLCKPWTYRILHQTRASLLKNREINAIFLNKQNLAPQKYNGWWPSELRSKKVIKLRHRQTFQIVNFGFVGHRFLSQVLHRLFQSSAKATIDHMQTNAPTQLDKNRRWAEWGPQAAGDWPLIQHTVVIVLDEFSFSYTSLD